ncbi:unnamed protein product [Meloidogyne enterolobii]|uniref:Uncharacterized protein n=1 Tax=Meloidogyne enterolobii TaxID=390850 RepID=A0ACB1A518_MELEN
MVDSADPMSELHKWWTLSASGMFGLSWMANSKHCQKLVHFSGSPENFGISIGAILKES